MPTETDPYAQAHTRNTGCTPTYNAKWMQADDADAFKSYPCATESVNVYTRHTFARPAEPCRYAENAHVTKFI